MVGLLAVVASGGAALAVLVAASPETLVDARTETVERRPPPRTVTVTVTEPAPSDTGTFDERPPAEGAAPPRLEIEAAELRTACRQGLFAACNSRRGAVVARVVKGGPADEAGIRRGDVIVEVDGQSVEGPDALIGLVEAAGRGAVLGLQLRRFQEEDGASVLGPANVTVTLPE
jgi:predicted metalloprotease with PDZ domain